MRFVLRVRLIGCRIALFDSRFPSTVAYSETQGRGQVLFTHAPLANCSVNRGEGGALFTSTEASRQPCEVLHPLCRVAAITRVFSPPAVRNPFRLTITGRKEASDVLIGKSQAMSASVRVCTKRYVRPNT